MMVLITYDINTESEGGKRRLRRISKCCQNYGQRVQNSVFECVLDHMTFVKLQAEINKIIDVNRDSVRYYHLGNHFQGKVEHIGTKCSFDVTDTLIL